VSISAQTNVASLLNGRQKTEDIISALKEKKFRFDPLTMKIVMDDEEGECF
jgi:hypothetical protein